MNNAQLSLELLLALAVVLGMISFYLLNVTELVDRQKTFSEGMLPEIEVPEIEDRMEIGGTFGSSSSGGTLEDLSISFLERGCYDGSCSVGIKLTNYGASMLSLDSVKIYLDGSEVKAVSALQIPYIEIIDLDFPAESGQEYELSAELISGSESRSKNYTFRAQFEQEPETGNITGNITEEPSFEPLIYKTCAKDSSGRCENGTFVRSVYFEKEALVSDPFFSVEEIYAGSENDSTGNFVDRVEDNTTFYSYVKCGGLYSENWVTYKLPPLNFSSLNIISSNFSIGAPTCNSWDCSLIAPRTPRVRLRVYTWNYSGNEWSAISSDLFKGVRCPCRINVTLPYYPNLVKAEGWEREIRTRFVFLCDDSCASGCFNPELSFNENFTLELKANGSIAWSGLNTEAGAGYLVLDSRTYGTPKANASIGSFEYNEMEHFPIYLPAGSENVSVVFSRQASDLDKIDIYTTPTVSSIIGFRINSADAVYSEFAFAVFYQNRLHIGMPFSVLVEGSTEITAVETEGCVKPVFILPVKDESAGLCNYEKNSFSLIGNGTEIYLLQGKGDVWEYAYGVRVDPDFSISKVSKPISVTGIHSAINSLQVDSEKGYYDIYNPSTFELIVYLEKANNTEMIRLPASGNIRGYGELISSRVVSLIKS